MPKLKIAFDPAIFNDTYLPYIESPDRFLIFYGGAGSGKSQFIAQRYLYNCLKQKYFRLIFCRKVARTVRNSQFRLFKDLIEAYSLQEFFTIRESNMDIECANGNIMISAGMDDREKIKSFAEPTDIWMEEATEFQRQDLSQLNLRLRSKKPAYNQIVMSFNPITNEHWIYEDFFLKKKQANIIHTTYKHNTFLPEEYKKELNNLEFTDENYYKVYCLGEWGGSVRGAIYTHWQLCDNIPEGCDIFYGLDFGFNNPSALVKIGIKENAIYTQQILYRSNLTNQDLISQLKEHNIGRMPIYADSAEPQRIEEIYRAGFNIKSASKEKDSVKKGIDSIKARELFITSDSSDTLKEIRNYKWAEDRNGNTLDAPVKFLDHSLDALRYAIHSHLTKPSAKYVIGAV